ncbi:MAG TPA: zinc ribbon domain-containing protein [Candidatus Goldiibacteriota bacterium]|nr:zinc ribbon domain-containing protein [Candidatus Goldiibacteriota bacterium]
MQKKIYKFSVKIILNGILIMLALMVLVREKIDLEEVKFICVIMSAFLIWGLFLSRRRVFIDQDTIEFHGALGKKQTFKWSQIKHLRENISMRRIDLLDENKKRLMFVDYQMRQYDELVNEIFNRASLIPKLVKVPIQSGIKERKAMSFNRNGFSYVEINNNGLILENGWQKLNIEYKNIKELKYGCEKYDSARIFISTANTDNKYMIYNKHNLPYLYFAIKAGILNNICKQCGLINSSSSKFCGECGSSFAE